MRTAEDLAEWQGYLTLPEVNVLKKYAAKIPQDGTAINIGAGAGTSTISMLEGNSAITVFSVDLRTDEKEHLTNEHLRMKEVPRDISRRAIRIWGDSGAVGIAWPTAFPVDLVFVDGDHSYHGATRDVEAWKPKLKDGGYMLFHDYGSHNWPDVWKVVEEWGVALKIVEVVDTICVTRKMY
jgi:predicted O-methyltransferase YrrM